MNNGEAEMLALIAALDGDEQLQVAVGVAVGQFRRRRDAYIRDMEAARLLPLGAEVVAIRQGCHRVTAYRRAARAAIVAPISPLATSG